MQTAHLQLRPPASKQKRPIHSRHPGPGAGVFLRAGLHDGGVRFRSPPGDSVAQFWINAVCSRNAIYHSKTARFCHAAPRQVPYNDDCQQVVFQNPSSLRFSIFSQNSVATGGRCGAIDRVATGLAIGPIRRWRRSLRGPGYIQ